MCLLDFPVYGYLAEYGIVLLKFQAIRGILTVLLGDVAAGSGLARGLVLGTFQDDEVAVTFRFLGHGNGKL